MLLLTGKKTISYKIIAESQKLLFKWKYNIEEMIKLKNYYECDIQNSFQL